MGIAYAETCHVKSEVLSLGSGTKESGNGPWTGELEDTHALSRDPT